MMTKMVNKNVDALCGSRLCLKRSLTRYADDEDDREDNDGSSDVMSMLVHSYSVINDDSSKGTYLILQPSAHMLGIQHKRSNTRTHALLINIACYGAAVLIIVINQMCSRTSVPRLSEAREPNTAKVGR